MRIPRSVEWIPDEPPDLIPGHLRILDQTRLPLQTVYIETADPQRVRTAIRNLEVRGAPAIGVAAAMGVAAAAQPACLRSLRDVQSAVRRASASLAGARPTAVNLCWALDRMQAAARTSAPDAQALKRRLAREAVCIRDEDAAMCRAIGAYGATLLRDGDAVLTHCNAGALATAEYGTALAPVYSAAAQGKHIRVFADETRPLLQGSRLTAWELQQAGIDVTVICDNTAAQVMREGRIRAVLVGADRIAANGDTANKIGTYAVALLARAHDIPFYVLAPTSTLDRQIPDGTRIPIEERAPEEVTEGFGKRTAPQGVRVYAPAFDVTPAALITAIVCEHGIARPDYGTSLAALSGA